MILPVSIYGGDGTKKRPATTLSFCPSVDQINKVPFLLTLCVCPRVLV